MESINFVRGLKPSTVAQANRKSISPENLCFKCQKLFKKNQLHIEHEIPVCIGGNIFDYRLFCIECHKHKTQTDVIIINFFKKMGLLKKINANNYEVYSKEKIIELYKELSLLAN